jgi:hypothetical protein
VSQGSLWLRHGDSLGTQEEKRPPMEAGNSKLVKGQQTEKTQCES